MESNAISRGWMVRQVLMGLALTLVTTFVLVFQLTERYDLTMGDLAPRNIRSPQDVTYISELASRRAQELATAQVEALYTPPDPTIARTQLRRLREVLDFLTAVRADPYAAEAQKRSWVTAVPELNDLSGSDRGTLLTLSDAGWNRVQLETRGLLDQVMRREKIRARDLEDVRDRVSLQVPLDLPQDEASLVAALVRRFVRPNSFYDPEATERARQRAAEETEPVFRTIRRGEVIVREGEVIDTETMEALQEVGLTGREWNWQEAGYLSLFALAATGLLGFYLFRLAPSVLRRPRIQGVVLLLLVVFLLLTELLMSSGPLLLYLFPVAALGMLLVTTAGYPTAVGGVFFVSVIAGWINRFTLFPVILLSANGLTAALTLPRYEQTGSIFRSGLLGGLAGVLVRLAFSTTEAQPDMLSLLMDGGASLLGGLIAGGLTLGGLFLLAPLFDLCTTFRLIELTRPNHPLLQRLLHEAPATFHHVMMVASLAEQAAERIGANVLLTRAGTYYHDIGKLARPYFFVENQEGMNNPHDRLDPLTSADILIGHVEDGLEIARKYHLPSEVQAFIPEHQGTTLVSYFYHKAIEAADGQKDLVDASLYRYPGPRPQRRETALVMLADGCEAATRAARPSSPEELAGVISSIFGARLEDGQLDECPITMRELEIVKSAYIDILRGAYHPRIKYPKREENTEEKVEATV